MIEAKRVKVGTEPVDVTEGTGLSGVTISALKNLGSKPVWIGEPGEGWEIGPGEGLPQGLSLNSTDALHLSLAEDDDGDDEDDDDVYVQVILNYTAGS